MWPAQGAVAARGRLRLTIVAPECHPELAEWIASGGVRQLARGFMPEDIAGQRLVIAATDDEAVNAQVSALCMAQNIPVNVVDNPRLCSFIMPSIIDRSPVIVAISSSGGCRCWRAGCARKSRRYCRLAWRGWAALVQEVRPRLKTAMPDANQRRGFLGAPAGQPLGRANDERRRSLRARADFDRALAEHNARQSARCIWWAAAPATRICSPSAPCG